MAINTYLSIIESKKTKIKQNKEAAQKQNHRHRECFNGCQMRGELWGWVEKVNRLRRTNWFSQNSHGDVKYIHHREYSSQRIYIIDMDNNVGIA